jgi:hypothetical protein
VGSRKPARPLRHRLTPDALADDAARVVLPMLRRFRPKRKPAPSRHLGGKP